MQLDPTNQGNVGSNLCQTSNMAAGFSAAQYEKTAAMQQKRQPSAPMMPEVAAEFMKTTKFQSTCEGDSVTSELNYRSKTTHILSNILKNTLLNSTTTISKVGTTADSDNIQNEESNHFPVIQSDAFNSSQILYNPPQRECKSSPAASTESLDPSTRTIARENYEPADNISTFFTTYKCHNKKRTPADGEGFYSMSSIHVSETDQNECSPFLYGNNSIPIARKNVSSSAGSSTSYPIKTSYQQSYTRGLQQETQAFDNTHDKGGYVSSAFKSLHIPSTSNNGNRINSSRKHDSSEGSNDPPFRFCTRNYSSIKCSNRGNHIEVTSCRTKNTGENNYQSTSSYHLPNKVSKRQFGQR